MTSKKAQTFTPLKMAPRAKKSTATTTASNPKKMVWKISERGARNHTGALGRVVSENEVNFEIMKNTGEIELVPA